MATGRNQNEAYSGLEVVTPAHYAQDKIVYDGTKHSTLEHAPSPPPPQYPEKQASVASHDRVDGLQTVNDFEDNQKVHIGTNPKPKKKRLIIGGIIAAIVVVIAVVGGVCGALLSKKSSSGSNTGSSNGSSSSSNSSSPSTTPSSGSSSNSSASMKGDAVVYSYYNAPAAVSWGHPHMEVMITNDSQAPLWLSRYPNATSVNDWRTNRSDASDGTFVYMTGQAWQVTHGVGMIARGGNVTTAYAVGSAEHGCWTHSRNNTMAWNNAGWARIDGGAKSQKTLFSPPGVGSWSRNRFDVFVLGQNGELGQYYLDESVGGWTGWEDFGGNFKKAFAPTVVSWAQNRYDLFLVNQNGTLAYKYYDGAWSPSQQSNSFYDLGGQLTSRPFAITTRVGQIDVFVRGGDAGLWHIAFDGSWGNWSRMGAASTFIKGDPSVVVLGDNMHVFAWSDSNGLLHTSFNWKTGNSRNTQFETIATNLTGAPTAVSDGVNVEVFAHVQNDRLGWKILTGGKQWTPSDQTMSGLWRY